MAISFFQNILSIYESYKDNILIAIKNYQYVANIYFIYGKYEIIFLWQFVINNHLRHILSKCDLKVDHFL